MTTRAGSGVVRRTPYELLALASSGFILLDTDDTPATSVVVVDLDDTVWTDDLVAALAGALDVPGPVLIGFAHAELPELVQPVLEKLTLTLAPAGPGRTCVQGDEAALDDLCARVLGTPGAAIALHGLLRVTSSLPVVEAITAEAAAYSMLLGGDEFARWRATTPQRPTPTVGEPVRLERPDATLMITLDNPARRNAFGAAMRDALVEALRLPELDPSIERVELRGAGRIFCSGGDLDEFGTASSPVAAYRARMSRNPGRQLHLLRDRVMVQLHGAAVGAGIELAAFAGHVRATSDTWVQLPELDLGLVPGAGGTVSIPRRIGRWRTAWMVLSGARLDATAAHAWGLVDELV
ncbi:enoyl-CoA hydratase/isomerase family protein [Nocardioides alcanivorans]|uniref:enoyl-CoA hydratase/isomerase family protein n=1 Tax=Nocardioides alcanivorans TaxID=2897352 RepID=UPI001F3C76FD|nr:enoyl-CoA hydratase/isomerase family protein [Nocardioides alcanivorans]